MEVFNNVVTDSISFSAQGAILTWGTGTTDRGALPMIATGVTIGFQRTIQPIYPIAPVNGKLSVVKISGTPAGTLSIGTLLGPNAEGLKEFIAAVTKECRNEDEQVYVALTPYGMSECTDMNAAKSKWICRDVECNSLSVAIQGGQLASITLPLTLQFTRLTWE